MAKLYLYHCSSRVAIIFAYVVHIMDERAAEGYGLHFIDLFAPNIQHGKVEPPFSNFELNSF